MAIVVFNFMAFIFVIINYQQELSMKYLFLVFFCISTNIIAQKVTVNVSIPPLQGIVESVGGTYVDVSSLMSDKSDPHVYAVSPGQINALRNSDMVVIVGTLHFEQQMLKLRKNLVNISKGVIQENEHWWLSTDFLRTAAIKIADELILKLPAKKNEIEVNKQCYLSKLDNLVKEMKSRTQNLENRTFYSYHGVFYYAAKRYNMKEINIEVENRTPTPRELLGIIKQAKKDRVRVIFMQEQFNDRPAKMISERTGAKIVRVNPLQKDTIDLLKKFTQSLK